jgi:hypothetical protein
MPCASRAIWIPASVAGCLIAAGALILLVGSALIYVGARGLGSDPA